MNQYRKYLACLFLQLLFITIACGQVLTNITFVAFDVETTGFSARSDRIIEIGAIRFRNGKILKGESWLINPGVAIPEASRRIHGITDQMVAGKPAFRDIFPMFADFIGESVLLAHNARFDIRMLSAELQRNNLSPPENTVLDTLKLARVWFPEAKSHSLEKLVGHLKITETSVDKSSHGRPWKESFHQALADSRNVAHVFLAGLKKVAPDATLEELVKLAGEKLKFKKAGKQK